MKAILFLAATFFTVFSAVAHTPDLSTAFLAEQENGAWTVQLSSALIAFEHEVKYNHTDTAYTSSEEFQALVAAYCRTHFIIEANGLDTLTYANIAVRLGHATDVVFQIENMPTVLKSLRVTNLIFQDIGRSQSSLVILKRGFPKTQAILSEVNGFSQSFEIGEKEIVAFVPSVGANVSNWTWGFAGVLVLVLLSSIILEQAYFSQ